jgi:hypothetical protein
MEVRLDLERADAFVLRKAGRGTFFDFWDEERRGIPWR